MEIREMIEEREREYLSPYAVCSADSKGREHFEEPCQLRTAFQRDRDRIIHSKAFRRLKHKTQVFLSPLGDHYRTRLTHTLEVAQIARTISRSLCLNEDLTEAIALGHDLGHTPFGHMGERVLDELCPDGFRHNEHSLRVVKILEGKKGLNLTYEVMDGILCHTGDKAADTLEGQVVSIADRIAYINHDIDDAVRGGVISEQDIPKEYTDVLGNRHSTRIDTMIKAAVQCGTENGISMRSEIYKAMLGLRQFMFDKVYLNSNSDAKAEEGKARYIIEGLYDKFTKNIELIPVEARKSSKTEDIYIIAMDYIAGMSDPFAVAKYEELYVPRFWVK